jgi:multidrug efflux pump subunit AcrA (membrane-fusion protein)
LSNGIIMQSELYLEENCTMKNTKFAALMITVALSLLLAACSPATAATPTPAPIATVKADGVVVAEGRVEPVRFTALALNANGLVSEVLAKEGDSVKAGQVIARLENSQAKSLESAQADALKQLTTGYEAVRDAQFKLDEYDIPSDFAGMTAGEAVSKTLEKLNADRDAFEPYKWMSDRQLKLTQAESDDNSVITNTAKRLKKQLDDSWSKYRKAVQWLDLTSGLQSAQAQLAQAQKDYDSLKDSSFGEDTAGARAALASSELRAPFAGTITNLDLKVGEFAASGSPVVTIGDFSSWVVKTTDLTEIDVVNIKEGQPVTLTLDAIPGVTLKGYVLSIGQNYSEKQGDIVYQVSVLLSDKNTAMRWGMTAEVKFAQ